MVNKRLVVFTDLDGTLLDHHTYSYQPALPALEALSSLNIPVILNSSKTQPEMEALREELNNQHPFVVENGAALIVPANYWQKQPQYTVTLATPRQAVLEVLDQIRQQYGFSFTGFNDMTAVQLAENAGMSLSSAEKAKQRVATEPLLWCDTRAALEQFKSVLEKHELQLLKGGRFFHAMGYFDKADAMKYLVAGFQKYQSNHEWISVALGDSPNDRNMLDSADVAIVIKSANSDQIALTHCQRIIRSSQPGPVGWNECMLDLLEQQGMLDQKNITKIRQDYG